MLSLSFFPTVQSRRRKTGTGIFFPGRAVCWKKFSCYGNSDLRGIIIDSSFFCPNPGCFAPVRPFPPKKLLELFENHGLRTVSAQNVEHFADLFDHRRGCRTSLIYFHTKTHISRALAPDIKTIRKEYL
jgi:hypothetical protein